MSFLEKELCKNNKKNISKKKNIHQLSFIIIKKIYKARLSLRMISIYKKNVLLLFKT